MNRKIFTLLASALMLFSTAFYATGATRFSDKCVGDTVRSLPDGMSVGMYHIRVDSIYVPGTGWASVIGTDLRTTTGLSMPYDYEAKDTLVLAAYESGEVGVVSMNALKKALAESWDKTKEEDKTAKMADFQATMWCTDVLDAAQAGAWPTFHFLNKAMNMELDWEQTGVTIVGNNKGWMFSEAYKEGQLAYSRPMYRTPDNGKEKEIYNVLTLSRNKAGADSLLNTVEVKIEDFLAEKVDYMLKFSIVKVSPFVLGKAEINTLLNTKGEDWVKLYFDPEKIGTDNYPNYFGYKFKAGDPVMGGASAIGGNPKELGYVSVTTVGGAIWNVGSTDENMKDLRYTNDLSTKYLRIHASGKVGDDTGNRNYNYRFVYFPSEDSLVINAHTVGHVEHADYGTNQIYDKGDYVGDGSGAPYWYGLYNNTIHNALIVRRQDLNATAEGGMLMTIGKHPANVRMFFNTGCKEVYNDAVEVQPGIYTIWDNRGRCLGVRMYNGSYSPQWMELAEGECPDRIPSYQWVVEESKVSKRRINITNREFGTAGLDKISIENVLIRYNPSDNAGFQQFTKNHAGKFAYMSKGYSLSMAGAYEPIWYGYFQGQRLDVVDQTNCDVKVGAGTGGGFRPVNNVYVVDKYLGYKHFNVETNPSSPAFGKSEDNGTEWGMDYNAWLFNYLHNYGDNYNISLEPNYTDTLLRVEENDATAFQFMLGTKIRKDNKYKEEPFGYVGNLTGGNITWNGGGAKVPAYKQSKPLQLLRYYYELKVADFYEYRTGLAEQYVVLKGAKNDGSDIRNAKKYGVADFWADSDPLKYTNIYLRETYFLPKERVAGEERKKEDPSRRVYYSLLNRIEAEQLKTLTDLGLEVSDTLMAADGTTKYNLVTLAVDDNSGFIHAQGKTVSSARVSAFALLNRNYPLYRRLNSVETDGANVEGTFKFKGDSAFSLGEGTVDESVNTNYDAPKILRFYTQKNSAEYLYEDALSQDSYGKGSSFNPSIGAGGINFLGLANIYTYPEKLSEDGTLKYNYNMFVDTAYINRGTGPIKPQYLIGVNPEIVKAKRVAVLDACEELDTLDLIPYIRARYLVNATDSARVLCSNGTDKVTIRDKEYINNTSWDRLAFVDAIHVNDRLYIVSELVNKLGANWEELLTVKDVTTGEKYLNLSLLMTKDIVEKYKLVPREKEECGVYGTYYDFGDWYNYHNDVCFSLRFVDRNAQNARLNDGLGGADNDTKRFLIESETTNRTPFGNRKIAPVQGGWVKINNGVAILSRSSYEDAIGQAEIFNVQTPDAEGVDQTYTQGDPTSNEAVAPVKVIAGKGEVTILNAAGKKVTVSNVLGQSVANTVLSSDKATVKVSEGVVVVSIEGEKSVKAIVK